MHRNNDQIAISGTLSSEDIKFLHDFLEDHPDTALFFANKQYNFRDITFTLSHYLAMRRTAMGSNSLFQKKNYDVLAVKSQGTYGIVFDVIKTFEFTPQTLIEMPDRHHIVKLTADTGNKKVKYKIENRSITSSSSLTAQREMENQKHDQRSRPKNFQTFIAPDQTGTQAQVNLVTSRLFRGTDLWTQLTKGRLTNPLQLCEASIEMARALKEQVSELPSETDNAFIHRDIKPDNIVFDPVSKKTNIIDFSMLTRNTIADGACGTGIYIAPESYEAWEYSIASDIYALGISIAITWGNQSIINITPQMITDPESRRNLIKNDSRFQHYPDLRLLLEEMTDPDPKNRPSIDEVIQALFKVYLDVLLKSISREIRGLIDTNKMTTSFQAGLVFRKAILTEGNANQNPKQYFYDSLDNCLAALSTFSQTIKLPAEKAEKILSCYIKEFLHGAGWSYLRHAPSLTPASLLQRSKTLMARDLRITQSYQLLIAKAKANAILAHTDETRQAQIQTFIAALNAKLKRRAEKPFDLDELHESTKSMERKLDLHRARLFYFTATTSEKFVSDLDKVLNTVIDTEIKRLIENLREDGKQQFANTVPSLRIG